MADPQSGNTGRHTHTGSTYRANDYAFWWSMSSSVARGCWCCCCLADSRMSGRVWFASQNDNWAPNFILMTFTTITELRGLLTGFRGTICVQCDVISTQPCMPKHSSGPHPHSFLDLIHPWMIQKQQRLVIINTIHPATNTTLLRGILSRGFRATKRKERSLKSSLNVMQFTK